MLSITFQNTVLTAQKVIMVPDESEFLAQRTPHDKPLHKTNKFVFVVTIIMIPLQCQDSISCECLLYFFIADSSYMYMTTAGQRRSMRVATLLAILGVQVHSNGP